MMFQYKKRKKKVRRQVPQKNAATKLPRWHWHLHNWKCET